MLKILIVEDEPKVAGFIKSCLNENKYHVEIASDGIMAKRLTNQNRYDLVILDLVIPHINGMDLCRIIKEVRPNMPIIMVTALGTTANKLEGFEAGADDYLVKPFEMLELLARIKVLIKRFSGDVIVGNKMIFENLEFDLETMTATRGGQTITLTTKEALLLEYFMRNKGRIVSRAEITANVWNLKFDTGTNIVEVYINILRKKIDKDFDRKLIQTRIGMGYIFGEEK
jgi:DNA-binding response OmpR family regulator